MVEHTAEITSLLRTIIIIVIVYYGYKVISRYLFPVFIGWAAKKAQQKFQDQINKQFGGSSPNNSANDSRVEGDVKIDTNKAKRPSSKQNDFGEYVDFEEVE